MSRPPSQPVAPAAARVLAFPEFVAMLAMMFATIAFSVDAMLPALPAIGRDLAPEAVNRAQLIVTIFVLGMGVGTIIAGPVSDALGRKRVVSVGLAIYGLAALVAAQAQSMEVLLGARFVQGLGAAAPRVVTLAMVRDLYQGRSMARVMSFVMTVFILVPAIAPTLGAGIIALSSWRGVFVAFVIFGVLSGSWLWLRQPETLPPERRRPLSARPLIDALREVLTSRLVVTYIAALSLGFGQMFAWLSSAPQIFTDVYGRGDVFHYYFAAVAMFAGSASLVNARLVMRLGMRRLATTAFAAQSSVSALMLLVLALSLPAGWEFPFFLGYMCVAFFMIGLTFGNLNALALEPVGHIAGLAAAVVGSLSSIFAVIIAIPIGQMYDGSPVPVVTGVMVCSAAAFALMLTTRSRDPAAAA
ncbi:multidrug MFS transporter [Rhodobacteraceae bacterium WD3A24]|nr:multidrug MFS transporter [Rhodobacteraceae bacterium WD3A24]